MVQGYWIVASLRRGMGERVIARVRARAGVDPARACRQSYLWGLSAVKWQIGSCRLGVGVIIGVPGHSTGGGGWLG